MSLIEVIGFIITLLLFIYLSIRQTWGGRRTGQYQEEEEEEDAGKAIMRALNLSNEDIAEYERSLAQEQTQAPQKMPPPPPPPQQKQHGAEQYLPTPKLEGYHEKSTVEKEKIPSPVKLSARHGLKLETLVNPYAITAASGHSRGKTLLKRIKSKQDAIVLHEIISKPRAYHDYDVDRR